jgi:hypothetical protein
MNHHRLLTLLSVFAMALLAVHLADDFILGFDKSVLASPYPIGIWVVWLWGLVLWRDRLGGRIILLLGGLMALGMPIIHIHGRGFGDDFVHSGAALRFIWILYTLGAIGPLMIILAVKEIVSGRGRTGVRAA